MKKPLVLLFLAMLLLAVYAQAEARLGPVRWGSVQSGIWASAKHPSDSPAMQETPVPVAKALQARPTRTPRPSPTPQPIPPPATPATTNLMALLAALVAVVILAGIWINRKRVY